MPNRVNKKLKDLVSRLSAAPLVSSQLNMYQGTAGEPLRKNLLLFLDSMVAREPQFLFLGEAAGVHGARWTGIPFTDSLTLRFPPLVGNVSAFDRSYRLAANFEYEQSSCPLWRVMQIHERIELLWNACPFVPFFSYDPELATRMRDTLQSDISPYDSLMEDLLSAFPSVQHVVGVGGAATAAAKRVLKGMSSHLLLHGVRHPSRQANVFITEALEVLGDPTKRIIPY